MAPKLVQGAQDDWSQVALRMMVYCLIFLL